MVTCPWTTSVILPVFQLRLALETEMWTVAVTSKGPAGEKT